MTGILSHNQYIFDFYKYSTVCSTKEILENYFKTSEEKKK